MTRRTALVTGGTRGIGLGIARALAKQHWDLMLGGVRHEAEVAGVLDELRQLGGAVHYVAGDLAAPADRARLLADLRPRFGTVNALVNNAGRAPAVRADLLEAREESFGARTGTNLRGPYFLTQAIARDQVDRRRTDPPFDASIVFITSVSAERPC